MHDSLRPAYELAEQIRFSRDTLRRLDNLPAAHTDHVRSLFAQHAIRIAHEVTPALATCLDKVYERLQIPPGTVEAYVFSSPEIQAECYSGNYTDCIVRFSSGLIDLLDDEEVEFVAGHEIGHFLGLRHYKNRSLLMASGTSGYQIDAEMTSIVRRIAKRRSRVSGERYRFTELACLAVYNG